MFVLRSALTAGSVGVGGLAATFGMLPLHVWLAAAMATILIVSLVVLRPLQHQNSDPHLLFFASASSIVLALIITNATGGYRSINVPIDVMIVIIASAAYAPPVPLLVGAANCLLVSLPSLLHGHPWTDWRQASAMTIATLAGTYHSPVAYLALASNRWQQRRLEAMAAIGRAMSSLDAERILAEVAQRAGELLRAGAVAVASGRSGDVEGRASWTADPDAAVPPKLWDAANRCLNARIPLARAVGREPLRVLDPAAPPEADILAWPVLMGERVLAAITVQARPGRSLPKWSAEALRGMAEYAALGLGAALAHAESRRQALLDPITHLYNARYLTIRLEEEIARARRHGLALSLLFIDSDSLKITNDRYGHQHGDRLVRSLADTIVQNVRSEDVPVRYAGGDEFVVILPGTDWPEAAEIAERLRHQARLVPVGPRGEAFGTVSIGVATFPQHATTPADLVARADRAMYEAKAAGKDCVAVCGLGPRLQRDEAAL